MGIIFETDFLSGDPRPISGYAVSGGAISYQQMAARSDGGVQTAAATAGSYWYDDNHTSPGAGWLQLLMLLWPVGGTDPIGRPGTIPVVDYTDSVVRLRMRTAGNHGNPGFYLPKATRIGWWMQAYDPVARNGQGGLVNMFQVGDLVCSQLGVPRPYARNHQDTWMIANSWVDAVVNLTPDPGSWICLGSSPQDSMKYGCSTAARVLKRVPSNMGIVALIGDSLPTTYPLGYGGGEFWIDRLAIETPNLAQV